MNKQQAERHAQNDERLIGILEQQTANLAQANDLQHSAISVIEDVHRGIVEHETNADTRYTRLVEGYGQMTTILNTLNQSITALSTSITQHDGNVNTTLQTIQRALERANRIMEQLAPKENS